MSDAPINTLSEVMRCGVFTNAQGKVFVVHDRDITLPVDWVEYDEHKKKVSFVLEGGVMQDLGIEINNQTHSNILGSEEITIAKLNDGEFSAVQTASLIVKDY